MACESTLLTFTDGDLILRSGGDDITTFRVHRCVLAIASPFFRQMFTLPQPSSSSELPVLDMSEDAKTVEMLLGFIYPIPDPPVAGLDELTLVLAAASKYDMAIVIESLRKRLVEPCYLSGFPTRVYAIASRFDLQEEARIASRHTLGVNILDCPLHEDLKHITAYAYHQLLELHRRRGEAARGLLSLPENVKCMKCNGDQFHAYNPPRWWIDFEARAREELRARPATNVVFSMAFLAQSAVAGCERCAGSILDAHKFLDELKRRIDDLPSTI